MKKIICFICGETYSFSLCTNFNVYILFYLILTSSFVFSKENTNNNISLSDTITVKVHSEAGVIDQSFPVTDFPFHGNSKDFVATTQSILSSTRTPSRYEQGLEDYEEAVARVNQVKEQEHNNLQWNFGKIFSLMSALNTAWTKVTQDRQLTSLGSTTKSKRTEESTAVNINNKNSEEHTSEFYEEYLDTSDEKNDQSEIKSNEVEEGRYIKGDPLKGYYDFIITEGSYKFWAAFQLFTALLMIYSTFAAIYYSKVNPIVSDYDYYTYLGGRSLADDPEPKNVTSFNLSSVLNGHWLQTAAHGVEFVLNSIDRIPQTS